MGCPQLVGVPGNADPNKVPLLSEAPDGVVPKVGRFVFESCGGEEVKIWRCGKT